MRPVEENDVDPFDPKMTLKKNEEEKGEGEKEEEDGSGRRKGVGA